MERYDLGVKQGETFSQQLIFKDSAGNVKDLTGYEGFSQVRPDPDSDELICSMEITIDGAAGTVTMTIDSDVTKGIAAGCYAYDFAMKDTNNAIRFYIGGKFAVTPAVTEIS